MGAKLLGVEKMAALEYNVQSYRGESALFRPDSAFLLCFHNFILPMFFQTEMTQFGILCHQYCDESESQDIDGSCLNEEKENIKQPYQRYGSKH